MSRSLTTLPPCVRRIALTISSSSGSTGRPCSLSQNARQEIVEVAGEQRRCVGGEASREVRRADDRYAMLLDALAADGALDIAAGVGGEVDDHASRPHARDLRIADQPRRRPAGDQRGGDDDVLLGDVAGHQLGLRLLIFRRTFRWRSRRLPSPSMPATFSTKIGLAPSDLICSLVAERTSVALTCAPRRLAVAIAWRPATPTPITNTLAGLTVPAAVIIIGNARP